MEAWSVAVDASDLDSVRDESSGAIAVSIDGIDRAATIVWALKEFSHAPGAGRDQVDMNRMTDDAVTPDSQRMEVRRHGRAQSRSQLAAVPFTLRYRAGAAAASPSAPARTPGRSNARSWHDLHHAGAGVDGERAAGAPGGWCRLEPNSENKVCNGRSDRVILAAERQAEPGDPGFETPPRDLRRAKVEVRTDA